MDKTSLGERMKTYEDVTLRYLTRRTPVIVRVDGRAFHSLTQHCERPFDPRILEAMWATAVSMCSEIQGVQLAYIQSDEISFLLTDYGSLEAQAWFNNSCRKIDSVAAGLASAHFTGLWGSSAVFDGRSFNLPKEEVTNYFIWRQQDAIRNSVSAVAQAHFSHNSLMGLNSQELKDKLLYEADVHWDQLPAYLRRGACAIREQYVGEDNSIRHKWVIDDSIPKFYQERLYIDRFVNGTEDTK